MTTATKKKNDLLTIGAYCGALIACLTLAGIVYSSVGQGLNDRIDKRIEEKSRYQIILLRQIATEAQKKNADEEFARWEKTK